MARRPWWRVEEAHLLIELYEHAGSDPRESALEELRFRLLEFWEPELASDPSFRSVDSIRAHMSWVDFLWRGDERAELAPTAFHRAWARYRAASPLLDDRTVVQRGAAEDRRALVGVLSELRVTLAELVESTRYLPRGVQTEYRKAWADLESRGHIDQAILALRGPAVDDLLGAQGLLEDQLAAKTKSIDEAKRQRRQGRGWRPLKALLGYFDSILGSLTAVLPWLESVKEFKEITEASVELASESLPDDAR